MSHKNMRPFALIAASVALSMLLAPAKLRAQQSTDYGQMTQWLKMSETPPPLPSGTTITMANWRQYQAYMPLGMIEFFEGKYGLKMPADVEIDVGPAHLDNLPRTWRDTTEKYGSQTTVEVLPNGHYVLQNYHGGTPFPNPEEPYKGWKILANVFFAYVPAVYVKAQRRYSTFFTIDRFGDTAPSTADVVYRWTDYITDQGFPSRESYAPGTWYTEWLMEETPEQARYTQSLTLYYSNQDAHPFPDNYVFVPALRRSLRLATTARCAPLFGFDWTNDDAKTNGFNGSTATYTGRYLGDRKILTLAAYDGRQTADFPANWDMPLGFPKPSWGKWEARESAIDDITRISSEASGYCYSHRVVYADKVTWNSSWDDLYDSSGKLWKAIAYFNQVTPSPERSYYPWSDITSMAWDLQNTHATFYCPYCNPAKAGAYLDLQAPKEYLDGVKYGSPAGLMQVMR